MKTVYFATDHAGFELKELLVPFVRELGYEVLDCGAFVMNSEDDYPDFVAIAMKNMLAHPGSCAIILGGSGNGEAMVANKFHGVRAAVFYGGDIELAYLARNHNDANVLSIGARFTTLDLAQGAVQTFLETQFSSDARHVHRVHQIHTYEN